MDKEIQEGSIFYWRGEEGQAFVDDQAKMTHGWSRAQDYCRIHDSRNMACGCIRYYKRVDRGEFNVVFNVLLDNETLLPKTLAFEIDFFTGTPGHLPDLLTPGDSQEVLSSQHFSEVFGRFLTQADELIAQHGIPGTGWINGSVKF